MSPRLFNLLFLPFLILSTAGAVGPVPPPADDTWAAFADMRLSDQRTLRIERRPVDENPRRVNHAYRFTVVQPDGKKETAEWPPVTEFRHGAYKVIHAGWREDGYVVLVMAEGHTAVWAWVVDMRPGENRPDLARVRTETLTGISGLDGPGVSSAAVSGSVADGSLTVRLLGGTPKGKGEVLRATLAKGKEGYRWVVKRHDPPLPEGSPTGG
jgi:hypothetical protein